MNRIKLFFTRNWSLPGKQKLTCHLIPARIHNKSYFEGISWIENIYVAFLECDLYVNRFGYNV